MKDRCARTANRGDESKIDAYRFVETADFESEGNVGGGVRFYHDVGLRAGFKPGQFGFYVVSPDGHSGQRVAAVRTRDSMPFEFLHCHRYLHAGKWRVRYISDNARNSPCRLRSRSGRTVYPGVDEREKGDNGRAGGET